MSQILVQLPAALTLIHAVGVVSPVPAGTLAGLYNNLCAWAFGQESVEHFNRSLSPSGVWINLCTTMGFFYSLA